MASDETPGELSKIIRVEPAQATLQGGRLMEPRKIQKTLNANGFPCGPVDGIIGPNTRGAVIHFQQATNAVAWLEVDGVPGAKTQAALAELPHLSAHFVVAELACHHCGLAYVRRELLAALEDLRDRTGPIPLQSAYRCPTHNRDVGGASKSMHLYGYAADTDIKVKIDDVLLLKLFSGIGDRAGVVKHVDLRHLSSENLTATASPSRPIRWHY